MKTHYFALIGPKLIAESWRDSKLIHRSEYLQPRAELVNKVCDILNLTATCHVYHDGWTALTRE